MIFSMKKHPVISAIVAVVIPLAVGGLSALLAGDMKTEYIKPALYPPDWLFPVAWTILYVMMGIASYLVYKRSDCVINDALKVYFYQLFVNFCWPIVFFRFGYLAAAAVVLDVLIILVVSNIIEFYKVHKTAGKLLIPYLIWCVFALYLNVAIAILNPAV